MFWIMLVGAAAVNMTILHMNDHHSHLEADDFDFTFSNHTGSVEFGGYPLIVSLVEQVAPTIKVHAGDAITGTPLYTLFRGEADAEMMNFVCFDALVVGNHEFDDGDSNLARFIDTLQNDTCGTPVLGANVFPGNASDLVGKLLNYTIVGDLGIVGIDIAGKTMASSNPDEGTTLGDERAVAQYNIDALVAQGINHIMLLTHVGYARDLDWMAGLSGVDIIVGGDSHTLLGEDVDVAGGSIQGPYPTNMTNADGDPVCVVQAWEYAHLVGVMNVEFDDFGVVTKCGGNPLIPFDMTLLTSEEVAELEAYSPALVGVAPDAATTAALQDYLAETGVLVETVIAYVPEDICYDRYPGQGRSLICPVTETYTQGGAVCNLVALAFLTQEPTADIAIQNGGGCRTDIAAGNFTYADALTLLPFSNTMVTLNMTGAQIHLVLEQALSESLDNGGSSGSYPYAAGIRYDVDASQPSGSRVTDLEINVRLENEWMPIDEDAYYVVVTNDFIAAGRDGYLEFTNVPDDQIVDTFSEYSQTFIDYALDVGVLVEQPRSEFSSQHYIDSDVCDHAVTYTTGCQQLDCASSDDCEVMPASACTGCEDTTSRRGLLFGYFECAGTSFCVVQFD